MMNLPLGGRCPLPEKQECQFCRRDFENLKVHQYMSPRCGERMKSQPQFEANFGRLKTAYSDEYKLTFKALRKAGIEVKKFRRDIRKGKIQIWIPKSLARFFNFLVSIDQKDEEIAAVMLKFTVDDLFRLKILTLFTNDGGPNFPSDDSFRPNSRLVSRELSIRAKQHVSIPSDGVHFITWDNGNAEACCEYKGSKFVVYSKELETEARLNVDMPGCHRQALLEVGAANDL